MNRSTIYDFINKDTGLEQRYWKIANGNYPVFKMPYDWDHGYLFVNNIMFSDFEIIILFSSDMVVKFDTYTSNNRQVNIKYRDINSIEVRRDLDIGYLKLENGERVAR